ncbi:MAG TPA: GDSL-type esterase/lipase family protein [Acidimicrobiales bacterium]|nr:GDSL-type esterase/lipase family protein [Acidimicrobiales bacterium]
MALIAFLWAVYAAVLVVLVVFLIPSRNPWFIVPGTVTLAACALVVDIVAGRTRDSLDRLSRQILAPLVAMLLGAVALAVWLDGGQRSDGWGFLGVSLVVLGWGQVVAALRAHGRTSWAWSGAVAGLGVAAVILALWFAPTGTRGVLVVLAVFVVVGGLGLLSERVLRRLARRPRGGAPARPLPPGAIVALAAGAVLLVVAAVLLLPGGNVRPYTLIVVAVIVVVVGAIASNTSTDIVVILFAAALAWALMPNSVPDDPTIEPTAGRPTMVVFGDSYISGEGAERFYPGTNTRGVDECRRAPTAYPVVAARGPSPAVPHQVIFVACSGAKAKHIAGTAQYPRSEADDLDQIDHYLAVRDEQHLAGGDITLAVVSIGGNDFGFGDVVQTCIGAGNCAELGTVMLDHLRERRHAVDDVFATLRRRLGPVPVVVVPYPIPLSERYCTASLLEPAEHRFLADYAREVDDTVIDAATRAGFYHLDAMADVLATRNLRLCDGGRRTIGVHALSPGATEGTLEQRANPMHWFHNSFHPNATGHRAMADTLTRWLEDHPGLRPLPVPSSPPGGSQSAWAASIRASADFQTCAGAGDRDACVRHWKSARRQDLVGRLAPGLAAALAGAGLVWFVGLRAWRLTSR